MGDVEILLGQVLNFTGDPFQMPPDAAARHDRRGAVAIQDGRILSTGPADQVLAAYPQAARRDHGAGLILPGFVDAHAHFPQTAMIASWGKRLIDWLNSYTFPEEMKFGDAAYAAEIAARYLDLLLANGTTTVATFCTIHPESVAAFFEAVKAAL